jgi:metal-responsive CopG/Arc/MetJ family transcriptional regulator
MTDTVRRKKKRSERIVIRCDAAFLERVDRVADAEFEQNRSFMARRALEELIARYERKEEETA